MSGEGRYALRPRLRAIGVDAVKTKDASASEGADNLKRNEAQLAGAKEKRKKLVKKGKEASASEAGDRGLKGEEASAAEACDHGLKRKEASASEEFDILKKKKVMMSRLAVLRSFLAMSEAGKEARPAEAGKEAQPAEAGKRRMKVVKKRLPQGLIDSMMRLSLKRYEFTEEELVFQDQFAILYFGWSDARIDYEKALIDQYETLGYAEDETEVTDDEEMVEN